MHQLTSAGQQAVQDIAQRHGFSPDAVLHMLDAVIRGNGNMAQFSHGEFSGSGQWMRGGMTMVSDMFNQQLSGRVNSLCSELAALVAQQPGLMQTGSFQSQSQGAPSAVVGWGQADNAPPGTGMAAQGGSLFAPPPPDWWGASLRYPNSTGAQNGARYAYFAQARRLAVEQGATVTIYDTLDHQIGGFSQQQSGSGSMTCTSQYGTVALDTLPVVSVNGQAVQPVQPLQPATPAQSTWSQAAGGAGAASTGGPGFGQVPSGTPAPAAGDLLATLQKLAELHSAGVLTDAEFSSKKAEILSRL